MQVTFSLPAKRASLFAPTALPNESPSNKAVLSIDDREIQQVYVEFEAICC